MTTIIRSAFNEGRDTDVDWQDSDARKNEIRLDTFTGNINNFNGRTFNSKMPLEQICPDTGEVLRTFDSRLEAARWIVKNVLKRKDPDNRKATSLTGNMHMCMVCGYKSYGYYWKAVDPAKRTRDILETSKKIGGTPVVAFAPYRVILAESVNAASELTGVSRDRIRRGLDVYSPACDGYSFRRYHPKPIKVSFVSVADAMRYFGVARSAINSWLEDGGKSPTNHIISIL